MQAQCRRVGIIGCQQGGDGARQFQPRESPQETGRADKVPAKGVYIEIADRYRMPERVRRIENGIFGQPVGIGEGPVAHIYVLWQIVSVIGILEAAFPVRDMFQPDYPSPLRYAVPGYG